MLQIKELTKVYKPKKGPQVVALDKVSIDFQDKGMVFLLGKSGSGKSTLLNLLGGLDNYTNGEIIIKGKSSKDFKQSEFDSYRNTFIGFIFQEFYILEEYTVAKNIGIALELQGKKADKQSIENILEKVDLLDFGDRKPNELSGGQKQRVAIARALIKDPEIILADEPTGSLDSNTGKQIFETLKKLSREKLVIVVSHDRENSEKYADRIIELKDGQIIDDVIKEQTPDNSQGIRFINNLVFIKAGYKLTERDTQTINNTLNSSKNDIILSTDNSINEKLIKENNLTETISDGVYKPSKGKITLKEYKDGDFKLIKSRFPYKDSLKMGASGLKYKKLRLFFTIFLSFIAFAMFGIADTMSTYDCVKTDVKTLYDTDARVISIKTQNGYSSNGDIEWNFYSTNDDKSFFEEKLPWLKEKLAGKKVFEVTELNYSFDRHLKDRNLYMSYGNNYNYYDTDTISGVIELDTESDMADLSLSLVAGGFPTTSNQIMLTDYMADGFVKYDYCFQKEIIYGEGDTDFTDIKYTTTGEAVIDKYGDLIGKKFVMDSPTGSIEYTISGIVKTELELTSYREITGMPNLYIRSILDSIKSTQLTGIAFVNSSNTLKEDSSISVQRIFVKIGDNENETKNLFYDLQAQIDKYVGDSINDSNVYTRLSGSTLNTDILSNFNYFAIVLRKIFIYVSIAFSVFSCLLLMNFIGTSIANKRKEIGILRALGARSIDVYGIFFNESMIISLINLILAITATVVTSVIINNSITISVMVVGIRQILLMALFSVCVAVIGSFLPIYRFTRKKPIETINDR